MNLGDMELGWETDCWFCREAFTKSDHCPECDLYKCPYCGKCGCDLSEEARNAVLITLKAVKRNLLK